MAREVPVAGVGRFRGFHNGRKIRVPLPLWQGAEDQDGPGSACRRGRPVPGLPQRQENTGSAAVVARGGGPGWPGKHLSQGSVGSGASATAGKCRFRCRCGKRRRTGKPREVPLAGVGRFRGFRNGRKIRVPLPLWQGAEDRGAAKSVKPERPQRAEERDNMERRHFMFIPPEGPPTAASPKPSIRRRAQPEYSSGTQQPPRQQ